MVARIRTGKSMLGALNYNESKVKSGKAECIGENMFGYDVKNLSFPAKKKRFEDQMHLNRRSKTNVVHISLNFSANEKLDNTKLKNIASHYMEMIGFGNQPYLIYNHFDAAHPHVHILTTSIQDNGKRIPLHNLGRNQSEKARTEIENLFNLVKAKGRDESKDIFTELKNLASPVYGKSPTKESISKVVRTVTRSYKFTSIPELNAVLRQFNVIADRGPEGSIMNQKKGLVYSLLDQKGNKVGVPIKASAIYGKPTLQNLEKLFKLNTALRMPYREKLKGDIESVFLKYRKPKVVEFMGELQKANITTILRQNEEGRVYGITFIDNSNRVVFNGSDLGKNYTAKAIMEKLDGSIPSTPSIQPASKAQVIRDSQAKIEIQTDSGMSSAIKDLMAAENFSQAIEPSLIRKRRKKRRRGI